MRSWMLAVTTAKNSRPLWSVPTTAFSDSSSLA